MHQTALTLILVVPNQSVHMQCSYRGGDQQALFQDWTASIIRAFLNRIPLLSNTNIKYCNGGGRRLFFFSQNHDSRIYSQFRKNRVLINDVAPFWQCGQPIFCIPANANQTSFVLEIFVSNGFNQKQNHHHNTTVQGLIVWKPPQKGGGATFLKENLHLARNKQV